MLLYENTPSPVQAYNRTMQTKNRDFHIAPRQVIPSDSNNVRIVQKRESNTAYRPVIQKVTLTPERIQELITTVITDRNKNTQKDIRAYLTKIYNAAGWAKIDNDDRENIKAAVYAYLGISTNSNPTSGNTIIPINAALVGKVTSLEKHLCGQYDDETNDVTGGHLLKGMENIWNMQDNNKTYKHKNGKTYQTQLVLDASPQDGQTWEAGWGLNFLEPETGKINKESKRKKSTFFPADWTFDTLCKEVEGVTDPPINSHITLRPSNISVLIMEGTWYPHK